MGRGTNVTTVRFPNGEVIEVWFERTQDGGRLRRERQVRPPRKGA